jgi:uncharacterized lipoprotein YddW (UPF0748 family)
VLSVAATELALVFSDIAIAAAPTIHQYTLVPATPVVPPAHAEFRGIWIATVDNTDWPSEAGLPVDKQKKELDFLLDQAVALHLNAILLQVRPSCDALYQSSIEPWSSFLTGAMGKPPAPFYDPLSFAIAESHKRGLELHAWVNPFRVRSKKNHSPPSADSVEVRHPEWVKHYGDVEWLDPGNPDARDYSLSVIHDIVQRYDIDGIHIDDYFYPYPQPESPKLEIPFPDQPTFEKYGAGKTLGDWRRNNINDFVHRLYDQTKASKPLVKVGISPFGICRPGNPDQIKGFDAYDRLYADSRLWLQQGWADYFSPQLYWKIDRPELSFPVMLSWWISQNTRARAMWPGLYTLKASGADAAWNPTEIEYQIKTTRGIAGAGGAVHFSGSVLIPGRDGRDALVDHLRETVYQEPALVPATPWLAEADSVPLSQPQNVRIVKSDLTSLTVCWNPPAKIQNRHQLELSVYVIQWCHGTGESAQWHQAIIPESQPLESAIPSENISTIAISAADRAGRLGSPATFAVRLQ